MFAEKAEPAAFNEIIKGDDSNCNEKLGKISPPSVSHCNSNHSGFVSV
jgi:hypothetical protein